MSYQPETIQTVVNRINTQYFLPAIQREFVWSPEHIIQLFDSILRSYPIGSFLFWELKPENREKWEIYRFIENGRHGGSRNELANTAGVPQVSLVLDGQQRLTSLLIGLKGHYTVKKPYLRYDDPKAWVRQSLFINLLKDPESEDGDDLGLRYDLRFFEKQPENGHTAFWFRVSRILDFDSEDAYESERDKLADQLPDTTTKGQVNIFKRTCDRLYRGIWKNLVISRYTENDQDYDRVLDIFVRANEGGTKLSKSDLLLSMVTSKWGDINAREEIYGFVDRLNNELDRKNDFDKDFVMKTCLVLAELSVRYQVSNFSNANLNQIRNRWEGIKSAIERGVRLVNTFGIDRDTLTSANALIPIIYFLAQRPGASLLGSTPSDVKNASLIRKWFTMTMLNNVFGGHSDNVLREIRKTLQERKADGLFPVKEVNDVIASSGRTAVFNDLAVENFLSITYGTRLAFLALSLLYDDNSWGVTNHHQDHIFPRALFTPKRLEKSGLSTAKKTRYQDMFNRIGNLQLLIASENIEKTDKEFDKWITSRDPSYRKRHLIPDDRRLFKFEYFEEFVNAREELIRARLKLLLAPTDLREG